MDQLSEFSTSAGTIRPRRWFPSVFGPIGWVLLASWVYFYAFAIAEIANPTNRLPEALNLLFSVSAPLNALSIPLWFFPAIIFALFRGLREGTRAERIQLLAFFCMINVFFAWAFTGD